MVWIAFRDHRSGVEAYKIDTKKKNKPNTKEHKQQTTY